MKTYFFSTLAAGALIAISSFSTLADSQRSPFVYETPHEFFSCGDFDGDGRTDFVIADKETGKYRLAYQLQPGQLSWVDNRPSGIKPVSGFSVGPVLAEKRDALIFSSADANQLSLVDVSSAAAPSRPVLLPFSAALGPNMVVAADVGGEGNTPLADFFVGSIYNSPDENLATLLRNDGAEYPKLADAALPGVAARGNRLRIKAGHPEFVGLLIAGMDGDTFRVEDVRTGKAQTVASVAGLPTGSDYLFGQFGDSAANEFFFFKPGESGVACRTLKESGDKLEFAPPRQFDLGSPIQRMLQLSASKFLALVGQGEKAVVFEYTGKDAPAAKQTIFATNNLFSAAAVLPNGFVLISEPEAGKFSTRYHVYTVSGLEYASGYFGALPTLADNDNITIPDIHERIVSKNTVSREEEMTIYTNTIPGTRVTYVMVPIKGGEFTMGSPASEADRKEDEGPQHKVKISPFWMGQCEVTWNEYELFMYPDEERRTRATVPTDADGDKLADAITHPSKPYVEMSFGMGKDGFPAISMTQHAANKYCQWLSAKTGQFFRLPTEAEWEYAARAGTTTAYYFGDDPAALKDYGWFEENSDFKYQKVGKKKPNPWGLFDMAGNVVEWVLDQYDAELYAPRASNPVTIDPWNRATKPYPHSVRGGSWDDQAFMLRSAARRGSDRSWKMQDPQLPKSVWYFSDAQFVGFRIVRPLKVPPPEEMQKYWSSGVERD